MFSISHGVVCGQQLWIKGAGTFGNGLKGRDKGALTTWQAKSGAARCAKVQQLPFWIWTAATESRTEKAGAFRAAIAARGIVRNSAAFACRSQSLQRRRAEEAGRIVSGANGEPGGCGSGMAIYHCSMKPVARGSGKSAVAAAAYRAGVCLTNERDGQTHDFTRRAGVVHSEIVLPDGVEADWAMDRSSLWNAAERAENRKDARVAREFEIALPHELDAEQREALARSFAAELANRYGAAVDCGIHEPGSGTDIRNHHAHLLMTTRAIEVDGFGAKTELEWKNTRLLSEDRPTAQMQLRDLRQAWEDHANDHLARAGFEARIDHRSHLERGLEFEPTQHMGVHATQMERRGLSVERLRQEADANARNAELIARKPDAVLSLITNEKSVFTRHDVAHTLHRYVQEPDDFRNAFATVMQSPALIELKPETIGRYGEVQELARLSTREMVTIERSMIETAQGMSGALSHPVGTASIERALEARSYLVDEQRDAVRHVTGDEQIAAVVGLAGAGKSTMLAAAREAWEADGYRVRGAALAGKAAEGLEASSGIESRTLASLEMSWRNGRHELSDRDVLVIDEAGMVSSKQMARFVEAAGQSGAKLVLVGDPEQLQPIQAGAAFRAITEQTGVARLDEIRRQGEDWQREASRDFAGHRTGEALKAYDEHGAIRFAETREDARAAIVEGVMADREAHPDDSRLVLTYRRADVRDLNEAIRGELQARGEIDEGLALRTNNGERRFAEHDRILFLENDRELGVKNGMLGTVTHVEEGRLVARLDNGGPQPGSGGSAGDRNAVGEAGAQAREVAISLESYAAIDHGYATTIHKSQGATVDRAFVLASPGMDAHLAYVAMTRHREDVELHAGRDDFRDINALAAGLSHANTKETTLDYAERRGIAVERDDRHAGRPEIEAIRTGSVLAGDGGREETGEVIRLDGVPGGTDAGRDPVEERPQPLPDGGGDRTTGIDAFGTGLQGPAEQQPERLTERLDGHAIESLRPIDGPQISRDPADERPVEPLTEPALDRLSFRDRIASLFGRSRPDAANERGPDEQIQPQGSTERESGDRAVETRQQGELARTGREAAPGEERSGPERQERRSELTQGVAERIEQRLERQEGEPGQTRAPQERGERAEPGTIQKRLQALREREIKPTDIIRERQAERERDRDRGEYER